VTAVEPDLRRVILVDNSSMAYANHQDNGMPIQSWLDDEHDEALLELLPVLDALRFVSDVRSILSLKGTKR
jgi:TFIIF-interacting CTD phosphatase-like protein